jgi:site-specific recombinase XerC
MSKSYNPASARRHWIYTREELRKLFNISDSTISNWQGRGLVPVDEKKPQLFAGFELRRFLTQMRWPQGREPEDGRFFCHFCFKFRPLRTKTICILPLECNRLELKGACTDCDSMLQTIIPAGSANSVLASATNITGDSSDVIVGRVSGHIAESGTSVPPESCKSNQRWLYQYRVYLEGHQEWQPDTVDEHLRSISRMSAFFKHSPYEAVSSEQLLNFKNALREQRDCGDRGGLSPSTVSHTLLHCSAFYKWLDERPGTKLDPHLPGFFNLSRSEKSAAASIAKGTNLTFDQAICIFASMPASNPLEIRNRAIIAMFICTGIRIAALATLRGKHVNVHTRWINQDPREVETKFSKHIRTYCLNLGTELLEAMTAWAKWRLENGFSQDEPFFLPDRYIQANSIGLGFRPASSEQALCWKSTDPVQHIIKYVADAAGFAKLNVSSHDFRKVAHPFLAKRGAMTIAEEVALQSNFGHTPAETIRKHYASMQEHEREEILDELCRKALSHRSELELYLGYERKAIPETDNDFQRAKVIFLRNSKI